MMSVRTAIFKSLGIIAGGVALLVLCGYLMYRNRYPYGSSHCCSLGVRFALIEYAETHDGRFPHGESSPEASLSLLYKEGLADANTLRGMTIPLATTRRILESGALLGPTTCGWHYVEGLTKSDNPQLALVWCKEPLAHDGSRAKGGSREVILLDGFRKGVPIAQWPEFLKEQERLMGARTAAEKSGEPLVRAVIELPDHRRIETFEGDYRLSEQTRSGESSGSGSSSGTLLKTSNLAWYRSPVQNGAVTRQLAFSDMTSDPVTVTVSKGVPDTKEAVFRMTRK